jgi:putative DNA methylase
MANKGWSDDARLGAIPQGQETRVLLRHGFTQWDDLYPGRQHHVTTQLLALAADASDDPAVVRALRLAIIGSAEMAGLLSRWDRFYLKSYESMAGHRFNFTTFAAEPNVWGALASGRGSVSRRV